MKSPAAVVGLVLLFSFIGLILYQSQGNSLVRPFPDHPHPVVPQLPRLADELAVAKTQAEERAKELIRAPGRGIRRQNNLQEGQRLYSAAKADYDGAVEYLCVALQTRFAGIEPRDVDARLGTARQKLSAFLQWNAQRARNDGHPIAAGAGDDILKIGLHEISAWISGLQQADQKAIDRLIQQLRVLRLASWNDLDH